MKRTYIILCFACLLNLPWLAIPASTFSDLRQLSAPQLVWVQQIKKSVVPITKNKNGLAWDNTLWKDVVDSKEKVKPAAYPAAVATWWSLSMGIFDEPYLPYYRDLSIPNRGSFKWVLNYNLCSGTGSVTGKSGSNIHIGPNEQCIADKSKKGKDYDYSWQTGIFGVEVARTSAKELVVAAEAIYNDPKPAKGAQQITYWTVIKETLDSAGFPASTSVFKEVAQCFPKDKSVDVASLNLRCQELVRMWLLRNLPVSLSAAVSDKASCLKSRWTSDEQAYCQNNRLFSADPAGVKTSINVLAQYYNS